MTKTVKAPTGSEIIITAGSLDQIDGGDIVLRGLLDPGCLDGLLFDKYQRDEEPVTTKESKSLMEAFASGGRVPDVDIGMRGQQFDSRGRRFVMRNPCYVIDGRQRVSKARRFMDENPGKSVRLGAMLHFDSTPAWENERFDRLNSGRKPMSASITLRNKRGKNEAVSLVYGLCHTASFPLYGKVAWGQRMNRGELVSAYALCKAIASLHTHVRSGLNHSRVDAVASAMLEQAKEVTPRCYRKNVHEFVSLISKVWGLDNIVYRSGHVHIKNNFLVALARLLSDYTDFWMGRNDRELIIPNAVVTRLRSLKVGTPYMSQLASGTGQARTLLMAFLKEHVNGGRRKLTPRT